MSERRYQGREITATLQANSKRELMELVRGLKKYAKNYKMDSSITVHEVDEDPDGGWKALVTAHNFNPFKWVKEKIVGDDSEAKYWDEGEGARIQKEAWEASGHQRGQRLSKEERERLREEEESRGLFK